MTGLDLNTPVGQWVAQRPSTSHVFEAFEIDYCCGGAKSLENACTERQINPHDVLARLQETVAAPVTVSSPSWTDAPLAALCDHIEQTHHAYLKTELPRLTEIAAKVVRAHGDHHPEMIKVQQTFAELRGELEPHMLKEELILFPAIRRLEESAGLPSFPFGTIGNPIRMMEHEHDNAGGALAQIRALTGGFQVPGGVCNTYRALLDGLHTLEQDMHRHVHMENSILFPRAVRLERASSAS